MKWFAKFKISTALDRGQPMSQGLRNAIGRSKELHRFEQKALLVERALRAAPPSVPEPPSGLHHGIMRAVQVGAAQASPSSEPRLRHWLPASAVAVLVLCAAWWVLRPASVSSTNSASQRNGLAPAAAALELGQQVTQRMPAEMVAPLSEEWQCLNVDFDRAQQFLLASLP